MTVAQSNSLGLAKNLQWKYLRRRPWSRETKWIWNCTSIVHKLSLLGMQLREKYKENFDVSSEAASSSNSRRRAFARNVEILLIFSGSCIPTNESLFILLTLPTLTQTVQDYITSIVRLHLSTREFLHYNCALIHLVSCVPWMRARRNRKHLSVRQDEFCTIVSRFVLIREVWNQTIWSQLTTRIPVWTNKIRLICV
jgi:hypothetical protein